MDSNQMVRDLITGSDNINRMRKEVDWVVKTVVGLVSDYECTVWQSSAKFKPEQEGGLPSEVQVNRSGMGCFWTIRLWKTRGAWSLEVVCWLNRPGYSAICYSNSSPESLQKECVKEVHGALGTFLELMMEEFPDIKQRLQIFWDAAS